MKFSLNVTRTKSLDAGLEFELHRGHHLILSRNSGRAHGGAEEAQTYLEVLADSREVDKRFDAM